MQRGRLPALCAVCDLVPTGRTPLASKAQMGSLSTPPPMQPALYPSSRAASPGWPVYTPGVLPLLVGCPLLCRRELGPHATLCWLTPMHFSPTQGPPSPPGNFSFHHTYWILGSLLATNTVPAQEEHSVRASLVAQWLRIRLPMQGTRVRALVREDSTCRRATKPVRHNY